MIDKTHFQLSDYQRAVLTSMGITAWRLNSSEQSEQASTESLNSTPDAKNQSTSNKQLESNRTGLAKLKQQVQTNKIDLNQAVLVCADESLKDTQISHDILQYLENNLGACHFDPNGADGYENVGLIWQFSQQISFENGRLTTPKPQNLTQVDQKQALWSVLKSLLPSDKI